jgi:hypothetical protein
VLVIQETIVGMYPGVYFALILDRSPVGETYKTIHTYSIYNYLDNLDCATHRCYNPSPSSPTFITIFI